jgi:hypothetical protein
MCIYEENFVAQLAFLALMTTSGCQTDLRYLEPEGKAQFVRRDEAVQGVTIALPSGGGAPVTVTSSDRGKMGELTSELQKEYPRRYPESLAGGYWRDASSVSVEVVDTRGVRHLQMELVNNLKWLRLQSDVIDTPASLMKIVESARMRSGVTDGSQ